MEIRLANLRWPQIAEIQKKPTVVLLPIGSTEQHGPHLPLNVDSCCAEYIAEQTALRFAKGELGAVSVLVAPPIHYTEVGTFKDYPGTVGISLETEISLISEVVRSFLVHGFNNVVIINGHAPNTVAISAALRKANGDFPDAGLYGVDWWSLGNLGNILKSRPGLHAEEIETSIGLLVEPDKVDLSKGYSEYLKLSLSEKWATPDFYGMGKKVFYHSRKKYPKFGTSLGIMGDATAASAETGKLIVEAVVKDLAEIILEIVRGAEKEESKS
jgi:creatinine amidohydrolase